MQKHIFLHLRRGVWCQSLQSPKNSKLYISRSNPDGETTSGRTSYEAPVIPQTEVSDLKQYTRKTQETSKLYFGKTRKKNTKYLHLGGEDVAPKAETRVISKI